MVNTFVCCRKLNNEINKTAAGINKNMQLLAILIKLLYSKVFKSFKTVADGNLIRFKCFNIITVINWRRLCLNANKNLDTDKIYSNWTKSMQNLNICATLLIDY